MNDGDELLTLAGAISMLSLISVGGFNAVLPEAHRLAVDVHGWMSEERFADLFAIAQAAPGPNLIMVTLLGFQVSGLAGAVVATLAILLPTSILAYIVSRTWTRFREARWRKAIQAGMIPVTVGLIAAAALVVALTVADSNWRLAAVTVGTAAVMVMTRAHPLIPLAVAGALGYAGAL
jgi:chromate transporter